MATPTEHKTVQARILDYAQEVGWTLVSRTEAEARRGFDKSQIKTTDQAKAASPFVVETLFERVKALNTGFADSALGYVSFGSVPARHAEKLSGSSQPRQGTHHTTKPSHSQLRRLAASLRATPQFAPAPVATKTFTSGRIRQAHYDPASGQLDLHWDKKTVLAYRQVPREVYRRLCSAPTPAAYWEDRIAEEYPKGIPMTSSANPDGAKNLGDLFGGGESH